MNIKRYTKKKANPLQIWALVLPAIPMVIAIVQAINILAQGLAGYVNKIILLIATMYITQMILFPIFGSIGLLCSILALRKYGRAKSTIGAIVWNGLSLVAGIVLACIYFS